MSRYRYGVEHDGPKQDGTGMAGLSSYIRLLEDTEGVVFTYSEVELAIAKLEAYVEEKGTLIVISRSTGHTHTPTENNTPDTDTHTRQEQHPKLPNEHLSQIT